MAQKPVRQGEPVNYLVQFSGGVGSYLAAQRLIVRFGRDKVRLLFSDTLIEDEDLYRFLDQAVAKLGVPFVRIAEGRTPWEVFRDVRFLGNSRIDPCSRVLKRDLLRAWIDEHCDPSETIVALGIDWSEIHRLEKARPRWEPWQLVAPLCDPPYLSKAQAIQALVDDGIEVPRLYKLGMPHNNCGGGCVKAGITHFRRLLAVLPERYGEWEREEAKLREQLGDVSILKDRRGDTCGRPYTLEELRNERGPLPLGEQGEGEWGGCGCAIE